MKAEKTRRAEAVTALGEAFRQKVTSVTLHAYEMGLEDIPAEQVEQAAFKAMRVCKFFPSVAELRELAGVAAPADKALIAWQVVEDSTSIGSYRSVDFSDPVINATIRSLGGWPEILSRSEEEFSKWVRKDFLATYAALARTGVSEEAGRPLGGLSASGSVTHSDGRMSHWEAAPPIRIDVVHEAASLSQQSQPRLEDSRR